MRLSYVLLAFACFAPALCAQPHPLEGVWSGTVVAPQGEAELGFKFERDPDGKLVLTMHMPVMHLYGQLIGPYVEEANGSYRIPFLDTSWTIDGEALVGTFALGKLPMRLERGRPFSATKSPVVDAPVGPAPRWRYALGAPSWASPVVQDGIVYIGASDGSVHAVRASDGARVWRWQGTQRIDGRASVTADALYFVDGRVDLVCLNRRDGTLRWRTALHDDARTGGPAKPNPTFNRRTATPLVRDGIVYCGSSDGGLYALNAADGSVRWRFEAGAPVFSGITAHDGRLLFGTMAGDVITLDREGREFTRVRAGGAVVTTPLVVAGKIIVGARDYLLYAFNAADGSIAWTFSYWFSWVESTPQLHDGVIYIGGSDYRRVSALDPTNGRELWATDVRGLAWGWPAVTPDTVFIGTVAQRGALLPHEAGLVALDRRTGAVKWRHSAPQPPGDAPMWGYPGSTALADDLALAAGLDGELVAWPCR